MQLFTATYANRNAVVLQWRNWALAAHHQRATILIDGISMHMFLCVYIFDCFSDVNRFDCTLFFSVQFQSQETVCPLRSSCWQQDLRGETWSVIYLIWSDFAACAARIELHTMTLNSPQRREMGVSVQISLMSPVFDQLLQHTTLFLQVDIFMTPVTNNCSCSECPIV